MSSDCVPLPQLQPHATHDARKSERLPVRRSVQLRSSDGWNFTAFCTDVNLSGIGIDSEHVLKVGQRVHLVISDSKEVPMIVIYRMGMHYGLCALASLDDVLDLLPVQG